KETGHLEGKDLIDVAAEEIRLRGLESKRDQLILEREAIRLAYEATTDAIHRYQESHQEILGNKVNEKFAAFTDRVQRRVELRSDFSPQVFEQGGQRCALEQLSRGAQDQLDLSIRLAVAEMISGDVRIPFIFDDPFLTFDKERLKILREALVELSKSRQVILLTHREELSGWGKAVEPGNV
ncbi:MAG: hypothetical protein KAW17_08210, partial [Candidatus Eisenbacteria sp.]|nr:hypothetical protein [Candidatus Eisenbacteria bacterium]